MRAARVAAVLFLLSAPAAWGAFRDPLWSARVAGLGGAFTAVSDDATGIFYNPAAFSVLRRPQANFGYAKLLTGLDAVDLSLNQLSYVHPLSRGRAVAVGLGRFASAGLHSEDTAVVSYTWRFRRLYVGDKKGFSTALSLRHLSIAFDLDARAAADPVFRKGRRSSNVALDAHFYSEAPSNWAPGLAMGLSLKALNRPDIGFVKEDRVKRQIILGARYRRGPWSTPVDLVVGEHSTLPRLGVEWAAWRDRVTLRAGADRDQAGTGIGYRHVLSSRMALTVDYAFLYPFYLSDSSGSHRAGVGLSF